MVGSLRCQNGPRSFQEELMAQKQAHVHLRRQEKEFPTADPKAHMQAD